MYVCMYVCMYVYIYIYTYIHALYIIDGQDNLKLKDHVVSFSGLEPKLRLLRRHPPYTSKPTWSPGPGALPGSVIGFTV